MKYKVGDKVRIKSKDWYEKNKLGELNDYTVCGRMAFTREMCELCGKVVTIRNVYDYYYSIEESYWSFSDEMFEDDFDFKNLKIGDTFNLDGKEYIVKQEVGCGLCAFNHGVECYERNLPKCSFAFRKDKKSVVFVEVKNKTMDSKEERNVKISIDTAKKWYNGEDESLKEIALQAFSESELKNNVKVWNDLLTISEKIRGCFIESDSFTAEKTILSNRDKCVFVDEKHAKSALAMAQISQLMPYYTEPIARNEGNWVIIADGHGDFITQQYNYKSNPNILRFKTIEQANDFLNNNEQLVRDYFMIN